MAAKYADAELLKKLLEAGADVAGSDRDGNTALHYAAMNSSDSVAKEMAEMLFEFEFKDAEAVNNGGKTALDLAASQDNEPLVKLLLMHVQGVKRIPFAPAGRHSRGGTDAPMPFRLPIP